MDNYKRFSKIEFILKYKDADLDTVINQCQSELAWSYSFSYNLKEFIDDQQYMKDYFKFIKEVNFLLSNGIRPMSMEQFDFESTVGIVRELVKKGQLKLEILSLYN